MQKYFRPECSSLKSIVRAAIKDGYTSFDNIVRLVHTILMEEPVECHITSQKNPMSLPVNFYNILTHFERGYLRGCLFTKFQQFDLYIGIIMPFCKNSFMYKAKNCFQNEHNKFNNISFELELHNQG